MARSVIVSAVRTPFGKLGGGLAGHKAPELGAIAIKAALERAGLEPGEVEYVIMGEVLQAGVGQAPARQAAVGAGIPKEVGADTVNKVCASSIRAVEIADAMIRAGDLEVIVTGGMESMSNAPYLLEKARFGYRVGDGTLIDSMVHDGLTSTFGPLAVDGLMAVASAALLASSPSRPKTVVSPAAEDATPPSGPSRDVASVGEPVMPSGPPDGTTGPAAPARDGAQPLARRNQPEEARAFVRAELAAGRNPSGAAVGRHFGRNNRWGQRIVREVSAVVGASAGTVENLHTVNPQPRDSPQSTAARRQGPSTDEADSTSRPSSSDPSGTVPPRSRDPHLEVHTKALQSDGPPAAPSAAPGATR